MLSKENVPLIENVNLIGGLVRGYEIPMAFRTNVCYVITRSSNA
jgi:hypothetical protein